jgi:hydrogenase-4 component E
MNAGTDTILVIILLQNLYFLGSGRLRTIIHAVAAQGIVLSLLPLFLYGRLGTVEALVSAGALLLKGLVIPRMLMRALADLPIRREVEPIIGFKTSLLLGAGATVGSIYLATRLPLGVSGGATERTAIAASFATVFTGFLLLTTRTKALTQVLGYLVLENGIYIFGTLLLESTTFLVEVGVLLDLFVAIFVMGIIINHISREFTSISTDRLSTLRD